MYIKSIVLDGFKSYGHRTEITGFDTQFNAITGLNGSGKSNVLDSICFVLGITNLSHVRVGNLQDLIYKSGQCGINKATVSITFDNSNPEQCPPGFENVSEITITRQIVLGGKTKYLVNGSSVPNKKVHDLFCSIQLNVNNPHFLIMQGKITKVLNMKPYDILAMIEEAAGTKMYEVKKETAQRTIEQKDAKLRELKAVINEELEPRLSKLRKERANFLQYKSVERELEYLLQIFQAWEYVSCKRRYTQAKKAAETEEQTIKEIETEMENHKNEGDSIDKLVEEMSKKAHTEGQENLEKAEAELKTAEKAQAEINAKLKALSIDLKTECANKKELEQNLCDDEKTLKKKETDLEKVQSLFTQLKDADEKDTQAFLYSQKRLEALSAGMELNEEGEAETLLEQLMEANKKVTQTNTEMNQANMRLKFCEDMLKEKQKQRLSNANETANYQRAYDAIAKEVDQLEARLKKVNYSNERMVELENRKDKLLTDLKRLKDKIGNFEARWSYAQFKYRDPEPNFNRNSVYGVVCRLILVKDERMNLAIEAAAGGRLYNVVVDTDVTSKKLIQRGELQQRRTFIPINQIQAHKISNNVVNLAQKLVGAENVQPALDHLIYDERIQVVMEYIFGSVLICKDIKIANRLAYDSRISKKCITWDGDVVEPAGVLSGGSPDKDKSILLQLAQIKPAEDEFNTKEKEYRTVMNEIVQLSQKRNEFEDLQKQLDLKQQDLNMKKKQMEHTSHFKHQQEIKQLETEIGELKEKIQTCIETECKLKEKVQELEARVKNSKGGKEEQIKQAKADMHKLKQKADKSKEAWQKKEEDYRTFNAEIEELKKTLGATKQQIIAAEEAIMKVKEKIDEIVENSKEVNENVANLQAKVKQEKSIILEKNKSVQKQIKRKDELANLITKCEVKLKEHAHKMKKLQDDCKNLETKKSDLKKRTKESSLKEAEQMSDEEGKNLEKKIRTAQENKHTLGRTVNSKAQTHFEQQEKEYNEVRKKQKIVEEDKKKIIQTIKNLDRKKEEILVKAYDQISKDFGSIFSTLLPGANAKLLPPTGQSILQGLEVKVSLGGVWKEGLTELSGGQRSLAALSLILAMLLFKPAPLYILDEVDAALDESHTQNIGQMLKTHFNQSQFIIVSLKDGMFSNANVLFRTQFVDGVSTINRTVNRR